MTSKFETSSEGICSGGKLKQVALRPLLATQSGRSHQHQPLNAVDRARGKISRQPSAQREADQPEFVEAKRVEKIEIMHDVVVHVGHRRIVAGFAEVLDGTER